MYLFDGDVISKPEFVMGGECGQTNHNKGGNGLDKFGTEPYTSDMNSTIQSGDMTACDGHDTFVKLVFDDHDEPVRLENGSFLCEL